MSDSWGRVAEAPKGIESLTIRQAQIGEYDIDVAAL